MLCFHSVAQKAQVRTPGLLCISHRDHSPPDHLLNAIFFLPNQSLRSNHAFSIKSRPENIENRVFLFII